MIGLVSDKNCNFAVYKKIQQKAFPRLFCTPSWIMEQLCYPNNRVILLFMYLPQFGIGILQFSLCKSFCKRKQNCTASQKCLCHSSKWFFQLRCDAAKRSVGRKIRLDLFSEPSHCIHILFFIFHISTWARFMQTDLRTQALMTTVTDCLFPWKGFR